MASGKKGKRNKGKTLALTEFLGDSPSLLPTQPIRKSSNWADEVDEYDGYESRKVQNFVLPTEPKSSRDVEDISEMVPKEPPYIAYLSNLPYDVEEEEIDEFFKNMRISNMRLPKEDRIGEAPRLKGYGYVEFEDRDSLLHALVMPDTTLKSRRIRIEVAANTDRDRRGGGNRMDLMRDRSAETSGDWRSGPRVESSSGGSQFSRPGAGDREFTRDGMRESGGDRDRPFTRDGMRDPGDRDRDRPFTREGMGQFNRDGGSSFGRDRERDRDGGSGFITRDYNRDRDRDGGFTRGGGGFDRDREGGGSGAWRDNRESRSEAPREFNREPREFNREPREFNREPREFNREPREFNREPRESREPERDSGRQRPKLQLAPRTKPIESTPVPPPKADAPSAASIFGNAKPVDTAQREREIEEKLRKEQEELAAKKERDGSYDKNRITRRPYDRDNKDSPRESRDNSYSRESSRPSRARETDYTRSDRDRSDESGSRSGTRRNNSKSGRDVSGSRRDDSRSGRDSSRSGRDSSRSGRDGSRSGRDDSRSTREYDRPPRGESKSGDRRDKSRENDRKTPTKNELKSPESKKEKAKREPELPKFHEPEPPNFVQSNKFAFLPTEDDDNDD